MFLMEHASHRISFPLGTTLWEVDEGRGEIGKHVAFVLDSRYNKRAQDIVDTPSREREGHGPQGGVRHAVLRFPQEAQKSF